MEVIRVLVRYYGALAFYAGAREQTLKLSGGTTVRQALAYLEKTNPPEYRQIIAQNAPGQPFLRVMVNETLVAEDGLEATLSDGDRLVLVPGISGGSRP